MILLIERASTEKKQLPIFKLTGKKAQKRMTIADNESILSHIMDLPEKSTIIVQDFKSAFLTQTDFKRIVEHILDSNLCLLFGDMSLPEISRKTWRSKQAKPYVDMIFAFIELGSRPHKGAKVGPPVLIDAHRETIIKMVKEGASPPEIAREIGFNRNTVYNYIRKNLPELKRDSRLSGSWEILDENKKSIIAALKSGTAKSHVMKEYGVTVRIFSIWLEQNDLEKLIPEKLNYADVKKMVSRGESIDAMRKHFRVAPSRMKEYLQDNFPEYYAERSDSRNRVSGLMKHKKDILKLLKQGETKKYICEEYEVSYTALTNFLGKIGFE